MNQNQQSNSPSIPKQKLPPSDLPEKDLPEHDLSSDSGQAAKVTTREEAPAPEETVAP